MAGYQQYVQAAQQLGFTKVTIIQRQTFQPVGYSAQTDIASAYQDGDVQVNENQELLDDWKDTKKTTFRFYQKKFRIVLRDADEGKWIVCGTDTEVCCAYQFNTVWFIVYGPVKKKGAKSADDAGAGFAGVPNAFNTIQSKIWDDLAEAGL